VVGRASYLFVAFKLAFSTNKRLLGGHTKAASYRSFLDNVESIGAEEAIKVARLEYNNILAVHTFARDQGIECELFSGDTVDVIYDQAQWDVAMRSIELMRKLMPADLDGAAKYTMHTPEEVRSKFHCKGNPAIGGISYRAGSLVAYQFVIGILKLCLAKGLNLQTNTPATALSRDTSGRWQVETPRGTITAERVVLATNGYTGYLFEKLRSVIVPLRGQITAHRPGLNMPKDGLQTTYSFIYANGYEYLICRPQSSKHAGDIIIGGGLVKAPQEGLHEYGTTDDTNLNDDILQYLVETTPRYFGESWGQDHPEGRIRKEWTGIMGKSVQYSCGLSQNSNLSIGYSPDGLPFVGEVPDMKGLYISASFQGHGMVLCFLCAKALVQIMCHDGKELDSWFPQSFRITEERMQKPFRGRLHAAAT
jgi:glycine/D-amino acid oxidase-like deaminating enzyme